MCSLTVLFYPFLYDKSHPGYGKLGDKSLCMSFDNFLSAGFEAETNLILIYF